MSLIDELKELIKKHEVYAEHKWNIEDSALKRPPHVLAETKEIKTSRVLSLSDQGETKSYITYNPVANVVTIIFDEYNTNDMTIVHYLEDGKYALLYRYGDMELVGLRIEGVDRDEEDDDDD